METISTFYDLREILRTHLAHRSGQRNPRGTDTRSPRRRSLAGCTWHRSRRGYRRMRRTRQQQILRCEETWCNEDTSNDFDEKHASLNIQCNLLGILLNYTKRHFLGSPNVYGINISIFCPDNIYTKCISPNNFFFLLRRVWITGITYAFIVKELSI